MASDPADHDDVAEQRHQVGVRAGLDGRPAGDHAAQEPARTVDPDEPGRLHGLAAVGCPDRHPRPQLGAQRALHLVGGAALLGDARPGSRPAPRPRSPRCAGRRTAAPAGRPRRAPGSPPPPRRWSGRPRCGPPAPRGPAATAPPRSTRPLLAGSATSLRSNGPSGPVGGRPRARPRQPSSAPSSTASSSLDRGRPRRSRCLVLSSSWPRRLRNTFTPLSWSGSRAGRRASGAAKPPVEPCPPVPRADPGSASTSWNRARSTRWTTSWAIRSPRRSRTVAVRSWLTSSTLISPR